MNLEKLKNIWKNNQEHFALKEIGELQNYVSEVLKEESLFNLKIGNGNTKLLERKQEFTIETTKKGRRADFVIYINGNDIIIPVEVERKDQIEKGVNQIFQYQKDWNKKYGILTDGNEWRFYKSNIYKSFYINNMLENPNDFNLFWKDFIKGENYYLDIFNSLNNSTTKSLGLNELDNRILFFEDITQLIANFTIKLKYLNIFDNFGDSKINDKIIIETTYAYLIQFILYKVIVDNQFSEFLDIYNGLINRIQISLKNEKLYQLIILDIKNISEFITENIYKPFLAEQESINNKLALNLKNNLTIDDVSPWLDIIIFINKYNFAGIKNEIFGFVYENYLKDLYDDENKGQFFTDGYLVRFMLNEINYNKDLISNNEDNISMIDPSCGAGTFLYNAVENIIDSLDSGNINDPQKIIKLVNENIYGLDIEEFPLYLAEMNILMRLLPLIISNNFKNPIDKKFKIFKTKDSISEFLGSGINSKINDKIDLFSHLQRTALDYPSFMRDNEDINEMITSLHEINGVRCRFDFVVGNPPYISYNVCSKQKLPFIELMRNREEKKISMGNVYGMNLNTADGRIKSYSPKPNLYSFFIALGIALLKENGRLCYIIPQTVLVNADLDVIRFHLAKYTTIEKIITFQGKMFIGRGIKQNRPIFTSSLIFVIKKQIPVKEHKVDIIQYNNADSLSEINFEQISNIKHNKSKIKQTTLLDNIFNWSFIKFNDELSKIIDIYKTNTHTIHDFRNNFGDYDKIIIDGSVNIQKKEIIKEINSKDILEYYIIPKLNVSKYNVEIFGYFSKTKKIKKAQGSRSINILIERKYKIIWKYINFDGFYYCEHDKCLPIYQQYCIASDDKNEILFLFSLLNSNLNMRLLELTFKVGNEDKLTYILGLTFFKEFIRIPKVDNENDIKKIIISKTEKLINLNKLVLKDFIKFDTMIQKFSSISIEDNIIKLHYDNNCLDFTMNEKQDLISDIIINKYIVTKRTNIELSELKFTPIIDDNEIYNNKKYIDSLIFILYFNINYKDVELDNYNQIIEKVENDVYYKSLFQIQSPKNKNV